MSHRTTEPRGILLIKVKQKYLAVLDYGIMPNTLRPLGGTSLQSKNKDEVLYNIQQAFLQKSYLPSQ